MSTMQVPGAGAPHAGHGPSWRDAAIAPWLLKPLYVYTIAGSGLFGVWLLVAPSTFAAAFGLSTPDPYLLGIIGAIYAAFGIVAAIGLRAPVRFAPILVMQLVYKTLWLGLVLLPRLVRGPVSLLGWIFTLIFASYVVLDILALPFRVLLRPRTRRPADA